MLLEVSVRKKLDCRFHPGEVSERARKSTHRGTGLACQTTEDASAERPDPECAERCIWWQNPQVLKS